MDEEPETLKEFLDEFTNAPIDKDVDLIKYIDFWWPTLTQSEETPLDDKLN